MRIDIHEVIVVGRETAERAAPTEQIGYRGTRDNLLRTVARSAVSRALSNSRFRWRTLAVRHILHNRRRPSTSPAFTFVMTIPCVLAGLVLLVSTSSIRAQLPPEKAEASFKVSDGLELKRWASEPLCVKPTCFDIDHK